MYFAVTGVWPLLHMPSFVRVTGPKVDLWLVRMVAALALVIGLALLAANRETPHGSTALLGAGSAVAFMGVDLVYVSKGRIGKVYLLDAAAEAALLVGWGLWALGRAGP